jgi:4-hydroxy-2-oxoheptanedioate aldolase
MLFPEDVRGKWRDGGSVVGLWTALPGASTVEMTLVDGLDYICIDLQHGLVDFSDLSAMLGPIQAAGMLPLVRVPANSPWLIGRALDVGAMGVVVPLVSSVDDAAMAVSACRYPPAGVRSFGPIRASMSMGSSEPSDLERVLCIVMIETAEGIKSADAIAQTPGIDAIYVGPADLGLGLGMEATLSPSAAGHKEAISSLLATCQRNGIAAGIQCASGEAGAERLREGFQMVTIGKDSALLRAAVMHEVSALSGTADISEAKYV